MKKLFIQGKTLQVISKQELQQFRTKVDDIKADMRFLTQKLQEYQIKKSEAEVVGIDALEARAIIQSVAENTQQNMVKYFTSLITPMIQAIWQDDREFEMEFLQKNNTTVCDVWINKDGNKASLFGSSGGGLRNIVSLGSRVAFWHIERKTRPTFFLDEPFSALNSIDYQERVSETIKELSDKLGIQFIIVSDQPSLQCDKMFKVENGNVRVV